MQYDFQRERIGITAGTFDTFDEARGVMGKVEEHIFLKEKAAWFEVPEDGIPKYEGFTEDFERKLEEWKTRSGS